MPHIPSANPDATYLDVPSESPSYSHGMASRRTFIPMAFQITSPFSSRRVLLPHALVMHINPQNYSEQHAKKLERIQTRGGWVEQHWGDDLTGITADGSTGAFMNIYTGLSSLLRQRTIAWDRYRDLHDLYRNNGALYDPYGNVVLQGNIMIMFDRGTYLGVFEHWDVEETDDQPFSFRVSWSFKVTEEIMKLPNLSINPAQRGAAPVFQSQNSISSVGTTTTPGTQYSQLQQASFDQQVSNLTANAFATSQVGPDVSSAISQAQAAFNRGDTIGANQILFNANQQLTQSK